MSTWWQRGKMFLGDLKWQLAFCPPERATSLSRPTNPSTTQGKQ
uniref:Uncharacterized protein n=1 Tax=Anguilla anguilla TaxID=7936 RepID=A0A0E9XC89_ANGAN